MLDDAITSSYQLDHYTLLERVGYGGHAIVWSAWDTASERVAVIKIIPHEGRAAGTLEREARVVSGLNHPHILPLYHADSGDKFDYVAMRYVCCGSLEDKLSWGPLPPGEALSLLAQIASALDYVHERGIVHRDLKPSNIMLDSRQRAFLSDFGLAKSLSGSTRPLHTGQGTAPYSPPEQHSKAQATYASDIYSLGIVIYQMLTGLLPWDGEFALAVRQLSDAEEMPDPRDINPQLPPALAGALRTLTALNPLQRPRTASAALQMVTRALQSGETQTLETVAPPVNVTTDVDTIWLAEDAIHVVQNVLSGWTPASQPLKLGLTDFMLVSSVFSQPEAYGFKPDAPMLRLMLRGALVHGFQLDDWWQRVTEPDARVQVCGQTILNENEAATDRAVTLLAAGPAPVDLASNVIDRLVRDVTTSPETAHASRTLQVLEHSAANNNSGWREVAFTPESDIGLARVATGSGPLAAPVARLIGLAHSTLAVNQLAEAGALPALVAVRDAAGSLPSSLPASTRFSAGLTLARQQMFAQPAKLVAVFLTAALGWALGLGSYVYVSYRVPGFLDRTRLLNAAGSGLLFGLIIGLGVFLARIIARRVRALPPAARLFAGAFAGTLFINGGFFAYHNLFLDALPSGWLIPAGSAAIALSYSASASWFRSRVVRVVVVWLSIALALEVAWQLALVNGQTPLLYFEAGRAFANLRIMLGIAAITSLVSNWVNLNLDS